MADETTETRLAEIQQRAEAATPGPWAYGFDDESGKVSESDGGWVVGPDSKVVVRGGHDDWTVPVGIEGAADALFIAHARADVPWLVQQLQALEAENAALFAERGRLRAALFAAMPFVERQPGEPAVAEAMRLFEAAIAPLTPGAGRG